uniref:Uncharacterized protein n=1 Tax=Picea glauca TaxID=3330 RepID=A0A117NGZ4_PICGL|nr:hypothetical protein ABT39_MTgene5742 [Picea glauca]
MYPSNHKIPQRIDSPMDRFSSCLEGYPLPLSQSLALPQLLALHLYLGLDLYEVVKRLILLFN